MTRATELTPLLKNLQLGPMAATLPERNALARKEQLDHASFLEIILSDEVNRRAQRRTELRVNGAGFEETCRLSATGGTTGRSRSLWTAGCWMLSSRWSFWTSVSTCHWWGPPAWARVSSPTPWATLQSVPDIPCFSSAPMTYSRPWHRPGSTTLWTAPSGASCLPICSSSTTSACTGSLHSSPLTSTSSPSTAIAPLASL